jgi:hypothetical protein
VKEDEKMTKYVQVGSGSSKVRYELALLVSGMKSGGQADVYFPDQKICIKVLHDPKSFTTQLATIHKILTHPVKLYEAVKSVAAIPTELVWDENGREVLGYAMEQLAGWSGLHEIQTEFDSESLGIGLESSGLILAELCKAVRLIHSQGFVIGDFNPSNILFKRERGRFLVKVIDVDSWSVYRKDDLAIEYASKVLDAGVIYHPDVIQVDRANELLSDDRKKPRPNFTPLHDWWAFACIGWMVLTKFDPFTVGKISDADREDRILGNHIADNAASVRLHPDFGPAVQALGPKLRFHLDRCLKRVVRRPFPTMLLEEFANNLRECKKCGFTAHASTIFCPRCATILPD